MASAPLVNDPTAVVPAPRETTDAAEYRATDVAAAPTDRIVRPPNQYWDVAQAAWVVSQR
jgi:hypothetical protein